MADLLRSLISSAPSSQALSLHHYSSDESFHSTGSRQPSEASKDAAHATAEENAGLPIFDLQSYLSDPSHASPLALPKKLNHFVQSPAQSNNNLASAANTARSPVPLGTKTSHHVPTLNTICQAKGLPTPVYDLNQQGEGNEVSFGGSVRISEAVISSEKRWRNKKETKEGLAEQAMAIVSAMTPRGREASGRQNENANTNSTKNWIGMLQDYHSAAYGGAQSPLYNYYSLGSNFSATCTITSHPSHTFGSQTSAFPNKKAAQANAAKDAVELLISEGKLNDDGSTHGKKKNKLGTTVKLAGRGLEVKKWSTYVQKLNDIAPLLGLPQAQYHLSTAALDMAPSMVSGYATFPNTNGFSALLGQLGEVRNVFGRKNAREEIAKNVWALLVEVAEQRGFPVREVEGEIRDG